MQTFIQQHFEYFLALNLLMTGSSVAWSIWVTKRLKMLLEDHRLRMMPYAEFHQFKGENYH